MTIYTASKCFTTLFLCVKTPLDRYPTEVCCGTVSRSSVIRRLKKSNPEISVINKSGLERGLS